MGFIIVKTRRLFQKPRPAEYLSEITNCAVAYNKDYIYLDEESECWQVLKKKYDKYVPSRDDINRMYDLMKNPPNIGEKNEHIILERVMCLRAKHNIAEKGPAIKTKITNKDKIKAALPVLKSMIGGTEISEERQKKRLEICSECDWVSMINGKPACGVCGCRLKTNDKSLVNLVSLEETRDYGCKHPKGSRWKEAGV